MALLLELPSLSILENLSNTVDPILIFKRKNNLLKKIAIHLQDVLESRALKLIQGKIYNDRCIGERALLEKLLKYLLLIDSEIGIQIAKKISVSKNMTLSIIGLKSLCLSDSKKALRFLLF